MFVVVCYVLFVSVVRCVLLVDCCSSLCVVRCLLCVSFCCTLFVGCLVDCSLLVVRCLVVCCLLFGVWRSAFVVSCCLSGVRCLLLVVGRCLVYMLFLDGCLMSVACCSLIVVCLWFGVCC